MKCNEIYLIIARVAIIAKVRELLVTIYGKKLLHEKKFQKKDMLEGFFLCGRSLNGCGKVRELFMGGIQLFS